MSQLSVKTKMIHAAPVDVKIYFIYFGFNFRQETSSIGGGHYLSGQSELYACWEEVHPYDGGYFTVLRMTRPGGTAAARPECCF